MQFRFSCSQPSGATCRHLPGRRFSHPVAAGRLRRPPRETVTADSARSPFHLGLPGACPGPLRFTIGPSRPLRSPAIGRALPGPAPAPATAATPPTRTRGRAQRPPPRERSETVRPLDAYRRPSRVHGLRANSPLVRDTASPAETFSGPSDVMSGARCC